jgi:hypothetical protein
MRISGLSILAVAVLVSGIAEARDTPWYNWLFTPSKPDFERVYTQDGKTPHNSQWETDAWQPDHWTQDLGSKEAVLQRFEDAGWITDIEVDEDEAVTDATIEVGVAFLQLSDQEKNHIVKYVDDAYGVSKSGGAVTVERDNGFWPFKEPTPVGVYSKHGLQLQ